MIVTSLRLSTLAILRIRLQTLSSDKALVISWYKSGLSQVMMKWFIHAAKCALKMHSSTSNVAALFYDLRNELTVPIKVWIIFSQYFLFSSVFLPSLQ